MHAGAQQAWMEGVLHDLKSSSRSCSTIGDDFMHSPMWPDIQRPDKIQKLLEPSEPADQPNVEPAHAASSADTPPSNQPAQPNTPRTSANPQPASHSAETCSRLTVGTLKGRLLDRLSSAAQSSWPGFHEQETMVRQQQRGNICTDDLLLMPPSMEHPQSLLKKRKSPKKTSPPQSKQRVGAMTAKALPCSADDSRAVDVADEQPGLSMPAFSAGMEDPGVAASSTAASGPQSPQQAKSELEVQSGFCLALRMVKGLCPQAPWHAWDTSRGGIHGVKGKVDITLTYRMVVAYAQAVLLMELKRVLDHSGYTEAIGQILDRRFGIFRSQPSRQQFFAIVAGCDQLEVLLVQRAGIVLRSGRLPFSWDMDSPGLELFLRVLQAPAEVHGFTQPIQADIDMPPVGRLAGLTLVDTRAVPREISRSMDFSSSSNSSSPMLSPGVGQRSPTQPQTRIYFGNLEPCPGSSQPAGPVAVKHSTGPAISREVSERLPHCISQLPCCAA